MLHALPCWRSHDCVAAQQRQPDQTVDNATQTISTDKPTHANAGRRDKALTVSMSSVRLWSADTCRARSSSLAAVLAGSK